MLFRSILAAGAVSLGASAFLIVPEIQPPHSVDDIVTHRPIEHPHSLELQNARSERIQLDCDECPFPEVQADGEVAWTADIKTSMDLNFSTNDGKLFVNDAQVVPASSDVVNVKAVQRRESDGMESKPLPLSFLVMVMHLANSPDDMELLQVRFTPLDIDGHPAPMNTVSIVLVRTQSGDLFILRSDIEEPASRDDRLSWKKCDGKSQCLRRLLMTRIRSLIESAKAQVMKFNAKLRGGKGCHGKPRIAHAQSAKDGEKPHHGGHRWGGPRPHHHPHHRHGWHRTFSRVVRFILVPAVLGVVAGLAASAIGMLAGQVIVFIWMRYRRNTTSRSTSTLEQGTSTEKAGLMAEDALNDELPPYSDEDHVAAVPPVDTK